MIGTKLLHYEITEKLGEGGMGVVYKARDTHLDRFVAIKVLPAERVADPTRKARFVQEAKAASALNHPNIITIYDISSDSGVDFIAMEYVAGKTLDQLIPRKGMRLNEALKIAVQIADALARAHAAGIIHRDLKPANIMVDAHGQVKVLDFGLAKLTEQGVTSEDAATETIGVKTDEGAIVGTAAYMSPEQAEGKPLDARSDIFSFGAVLYEMVTGQRAFRGDSKLSTLSAVLHKDPSPLAADVPPDLQKLIGRCLRKDPERRFQHVADVRVALRDLCEESDSQPGGTVVTGAKRGRRWLPAVVVVALVLLAAAGWLVFRHLGKEAPPPRLVQLTSYPGYELYPTFSPDGSQAAFTWNGEKGDNYDIYVKLVGEPSALRLTTDPAPELYPAWSPDGKRIAFQRYRAGAPGIWSISPLGGAEQKLADLLVMDQMSWSPDGKWLAVAQGYPKVAGRDVGPVRGIFLVPVDGGEPRRLSDPKPPAYDISPSFSPDGRLLAYATCAATYACDLFVQPLGAGYLPQGAVRRITKERLYVRGLAWSRDGESLVYGGSLSWGMTLRLRRVGSSGREPSAPLDLAGFGGSSPSIAATGGRLAWSKETWNCDIWRYEMNGVPRPFLVSSLHDFNAMFSPDGSRIAFNSSRSGDIVEIWTTAADGSGAVQLTKGPGRGQGSPRWSPDGRLIVFDSLDQESLSHIYVVDANGGRPRRVDSEGFSCSIATFSRDGQWIYFSSDRWGQSEIWRVPVAGGAAQRVTANGGHVAFESPDGKTLFYTKSEFSPLFARPVNGGPERKILDYVYRRAYAPFEDGIYYIGRRGTDNQYPIQFYDFSTGASRLLSKVEGGIHTCLSVSPDRKTILFSNSATSGSDLMLVENFR